MSIDAIESSSLTAVKKTNYRWVVVWVLWAIYMINYLDRMSVLTLLPYIKEDLNYTYAQTGLISSIFFFGYAAANIFSGCLADKIGAKKVMYISIIVFSFATFLTGFIQRFSNFILLRLGLGLGEGCHLVPSNKTIAEWFPDSEKGRAVSLFSTTFQLAPAIIPLLAIQLMTLFGSWRPVFFALAFPGIVGILLLWYFVENTPEEEMTKKGRISKEEYDHILLGLNKTKKTTTKVCSKTILKILLKDSSFYIYTLMCFFNLSVLWGILTWVTSFLRNQHGFESTTLGLMASSLSVFAIFGIIFGGYMCDKFCKGKSKYLITLGFYPLIVILIFITTVPKGTVFPLLLSLILIGIFTNIPCASIYSYCALRYPKEMVGTAMGISTGIGQLGAFCGPFIAGFLIEGTAGGDSFSRIFFMFAISSFLTGTLAIFLKNDRLNENSLE